MQCSNANTIDHSIAFQFSGSCLLLFSIVFCTVHGMQFGAFSAPFPVEALMRISCHWVWVSYVCLIREWVWTVSYVVPDLQYRYNIQKCHVSYVVTIFMVQGADQHQLEYNYVGLTHHAQLTGWLNSWNLDSRLDCGLDYGLPNSSEDNYSCCLTTSMWHLFPGFAASLHFCRQTWH